MNGRAFVLVLPLAAIGARIVSEPFRVNHFLFEYAVFLGHFLASTFGYDTLTALAPVAAASYVLYWMTRLYERATFVICSVGMFASFAASFGPTALVTTGCVSIPSFFVIGILLMQTIDSFARLGGFTCMLGAAVGAMVPWMGDDACEAVALALALAMCPTERTPVPFTPVEVMLERALERAQHSDEDEDDDEEKGHPEDDTHNSNQQQPCPV